MADVVQQMKVSLSDIHAMGRHSMETRHLDFAVEWTQVYNRFGLCSVETLHN